MVRVLALVPKRPDMTVEQFHAHWRGPHAELGRRNKAMRRYVQSHRLYDCATPFPVPPYNGVAEGWFEDIAAAQAMSSDPDYLEHAAKDEPRFIDMDRLAFMFAREVVTLEGPGPDGVAVKLVQLVARRPEVESAALLCQLLDVDPAELERLGIVRRVVSAVEVVNGAESPFDAVVECYWPDAEVLAAAAAAQQDAFERVLLPPAAGRERTVALATKELRVIPA